MGSAETENKINQIALPWAFVTESDLKFIHLLLYYDKFTLLTYHNHNFKNSFIWKNCGLIKQIYGKLRHVILFTIYYFI